MRLKLEVMKVVGIVASLGVSFALLAGCSADKGRTVTAADRAVSTSTTAPAASTSTVAEARHPKFDQRPLEGAWQCGTQPQVENYVGYKLLHLKSSPAKLPHQYACIAGEGHPNLDSEKAALPTDSYVIYAPATTNPKNTSLSDIMADGGLLLSLSVTAPDTSDQFPTTEGTAPGFGTYKLVDIAGNRGLVQPFGDGLSLVYWWLTDSTGHKMRAFLQGEYSFDDMVTFANNLSE